MTHKPIKRFAMSGEAPTVEDAIRVRQQIERLLVENMREEGYVPVLDIDPSFLNTMTPEETFRWTVVIQGVYVGRTQAWTVEGISGGKKITRRDKSKQSSTP
jgi:hypothetical protein